VAEGAQISLLAESAPAPPRTGARGSGSRLTSKGIAPGDIVEVDRKGRRFHALVTAIEQRDSGRFDLEVRPLDGRSTWRTATVRDVVAVWRRARATGPIPPEPAAAPAA
jgi:hypothetical protein